MSTAAETLRSLAQAHELLEAIIVEPGAAGDIRSVAAEALLAFPDLASTPSTLAQAELEQVQAWGRSLIQARWVMRRVPISLGHAHPLSLQAKVVQRHFPEDRYLPTLTHGDLQRWRALFSNPLQTLVDTLVRSREGADLPDGPKEGAPLCRPTPGDAVASN